MTWETKRFGDVCEFVRGPFGGALKKNIFKEDGYAVYEQQHAIYNQFDSVRYFVDEDKFSEMGRFELFPDDLIMSCSGTMGKIAIVPSGIKQGIINQALLKLTPNKNLSPQFLKLWMESRNFQEQIELLSQGAAIKNMASVKILKEIMVPTPSEEEQKRIVAILDQAFADIEQARAKTEQNLKNARELFESYLQQVFSQRGEGWEETTVGGILKLEYGKPLDKSLRKPDGAYPAYGANGVKARTDEFYREERTIIVGRKGSAGELTITEEKYWPLDVTYFVDFDRETYDLQFIYYLLSRLNLPSLATGVKPGINRNVVYGISIVVPNIDMQKDVSKKLNVLSNTVLKLEDIYQKKLEHLDDLKKSILQKAFSGELTKTLEVDTNKGAVA